MFLLLFLNIYWWSNISSRQKSEYSPGYLFGALWFFGSSSVETTPVVSKKTAKTMASNLEHLLANADQLFDQNQFQEALDELKRHEVIYIYIYLNQYKS